MLRDLKNNVKVSVGLAPQALGGGAETLNGEGIDNQGFDSVVFAIMTDAIAASSLALTIKLQESDDDSTYTDVAADDMLGAVADTAITQADDKVTKKLGYVGNKRYVRAAVVVTANDGTDVVSVVAIQGHAHAKPVA